MEVLVPQCGCSIWEFHVQWQRETLLKDDVLGGQVGYELKTHLQEFILGADKRCCQREQLYLN